jgi:hypothetical protein
MLTPSPEQQGADQLPPQALIANPTDPFGVK